MCQSSVILQRAETSEKVGVRGIFWLPTLQYSILGLGISKEQVWFPTPTGTFIGG